MTIIPYLRVIFLQYGSQAPDNYEKARWRLQKYPTVNVYFMLQGFF